MKPDLDKVMLVLVDCALRGGKFFHTRDTSRDRGHSNNLIYTNYGTNVRYTVLMAWREKFPLYEFAHEIDYIEAERLIRKYWNKNRLTSAEVKVIDRIASGGPTGQHD